MSDEDKADYIFLWGVFIILMLMFAFGFFAGRASADDFLDRVRQVERLAQQEYKPMPVGPKYERLEWYWLDGNALLYGDGVQLGGWNIAGRYWQSYDAAKDEWDDPRSNIPYDVAPPLRAASLRNSVRSVGGGC